jgi:hypothetical protein
MQMLQFWAVGEVDVPQATMPGSPVAVSGMPNFGSAGVTLFRATHGGPGRLTPRYPALVCGERSPAVWVLQRSLGRCSV